MGSWSATSKAPFLPFSPDSFLGRRFGFAREFLADLLLLSPAISPL